MSNVKHIQRAVMLARECSHLALYYKREGSHQAADHFIRCRDAHMRDARQMHAIDNL